MAPSVLLGSMGSFDFHNNGETYAFLFGNLCVVAFLIRKARSSSLDCVTTRLSLMPKRSTLVLDSITSIHCKFPVLVSFYSCSERRQLVGLGRIGQTINSNPSERSTQCNWQSSSSGSGCWLNNLKEDEEPSVVRADQYGNFFPH